MTSVEELIKKDAKRQLLAGTVLSILAVLFLVELFWYRSVSIAFMGLYSFAFTLGGIGLLRTGFVDWKKAKKTDMHVKADETSLTIERVPGRMYVGQKTLDSAHAVLVDMDGAVYAEAEERKLGKYPLWRKLSVLLSVSDIRSFECEVTDREGNLLYTMEKKEDLLGEGTFRTMRVSTSLIPKKQKTGNPGNVRLSMSGRIISAGLQKGMPLSVIFLLKIKLVRNGQ